MTIRKGVCYWPRYSEARAVSATFEGSRVVAYGLGFAVQLRIGGPYVGLTACIANRKLALDVTPA